MEIENYQKRTESEKKEEKHVEAVAHSKGTRKRNKLVRSVISEEASDVKNYILTDVLIPAIKKTIVDMVTNGAEMAVYGSTGHSKRSNGSRVVSYREYYDRDDNRRRDYRSSSYDFDDLVFESRGEAELVLDNMFGILDRYRVVTVADLYDLAGEVGRHTDNKFGWTSLSNASVARIRDGYVIKLPRAMAID